MQKRRTALTALGAGALTLSALAPSARAGQCAAPAGAAPALAEQDAEERLRFIREALLETVRREKRYMIGWSLTYAGFAAGTWALVPFSNDPRKPIESAWNSSISTLGGLQNLIEPLLVVRDKNRVERLFSEPGNRTRCQVLAEAERHFQHAANSEIGAKSAKAHITSLLVNVGLGLILGYGLKRPEGAAMNTTIGMFTSEIQIATRPTFAARRMESYRAGNLAPAPPDPKIFFTPVLSPTDTGYGLAVAGAF